MESLPEQNFTEDQKREIALRMAVQGSTNETAPSEVVKKAEAFFSFLNSR